eukprot:scaffold36509_cov33-Tisochrysis_lutea.AAC.4
MQHTKRQRTKSSHFAARMQFHLPVGAHDIMSIWHRQEHTTQCAQRYESRSPGRKGAHGHIWAQANVLQTCVS